MLLSIGQGIACVVAKFRNSPQRSRATNREDIAARCTRKWCRGTDDVAASPSLKPWMLVSTANGERNGTVGGNCAVTQIRHQRSEPADDRVRVDAL